MDELKYEDIKERLGNATIPIYKLPAHELYVRIAEVFNLTVRAAEDDFVKCLIDTSTYLPGNVNAKNDNFKLLDVVKQQQFEVSSKVYLYWDFDQTVDEADLEFVCRNFNDLWWPGPDDLVIIEWDFRWFMIVDHEGYLKVARFPEIKQALRQIN